MIYTYVHSCSYGSEDSHKQNRLACFRNQPFHVILEFLSSNQKKFLLPKKLSFQSILKVYCKFFFYKLIFNITCIDEMIARKLFPYKHASHTSKIKNIKLKVRMCLIVMLRSLLSLITHWLNSLIIHRLTRNNRSGIFNYGPFIEEITQSWKVSHYADCEH